MVENEMMSPTHVQHIDDIKLLLFSKQEVMNLRGKNAGYDLVKVTMTLFVYQCVVSKDLRCITT